MTCLINMFTIVINTWIPSVVRVTRGVTSIQVQPSGYHGNKWSTVLTNFYGMANIMVSKNLSRLVSQANRDYHDWLNITATTIMTMISSTTGIPIIRAHLRTFCVSEHIPSPLALLFLIAPTILFLLSAFFLSSPGICGNKSENVVRLSVKSSLPVC